MNVDPEMFRDKRSPKLTPQPTVGPTAYGPDGKPTAPEDPLCVAFRRKGQMSKVERFYVKRSTSGPVKFYDPEADETRQLRASNADTGRGQFEWAEVPPDAFDHYVRFLQSGNRTHLRHAERSV